MFSSLEKIMCLQSLFLSDSGCSGGAYFEGDVKMYSSVADCSAGVKMTEHSKIKFDSDGLTQTQLVGSNRPAVSHMDCEAYPLLTCTCDGHDALWAQTQPGRIHFISIHFRILLVT